MNPMEATNINHKRKRERDQGPDNLEAKKQRPNPITNSLHDDQKSYEFYDGIGIFDFPWLKEGMIFNSFEDEDKNFGACSYLDDEAGVSFDQSQNLSVSPNLNSQDSKIEDDDRFWSLVVDDQEAVDCIWRCVIDQPLDLGFNK